MTVELVTSNLQTGAVFVITRKLIIENTPLQNFVL